MATDADGSSENLNEVKRGSIVIEDAGAKVFKVEDTLFTVHTYFLVEHSPVFKDMLQVAQANEGEGSSEDNPIILEDIPARDFDLLVRVLYTSCALTQTSPLQTASVEECASLIELLERWQMDEILAGVRQVLHDRDWDLADKIALARATKMNAVWLSTAYQDLILRDTPPTLDEGARMGWPPYGLVRDIREKVANLPQAVQMRIMRQELRESLEGYEAPPVTQT
ncbi:uncharacterized protein SCHCODRAFT_02600162 [Schizophyllum commune H4-8]|uniref:BTB domain-containing protein n=1 Tax=Schizophyllum commune (strain H4-8 / FGSC 9210) TaxID=578458 RepID=D8Q6I0_SCHCM|nr:uncharacterized protein SCHCODRAFT_02600162 [Schizophyllum commune H4-8]KAI5890934.1 hypothetical protein SCHCODRAFT_02600162 [Schizophyllum commune H4-8]